MMTTSMSSPLRATATPAKNVNSRILPSSSSSSVPSSPLSSILSTSQVHSKTYTFPYKLYDLMVDNTTSTGDASSQDVVSWSFDGKVFVINNHKRFASELLPKYFGHNTIRSFDRQMKYWSFEMVHSPRGMNNESFGGKSWKHPFFEMGRRDLVKHIVRTALKSEPSKTIRDLKKGTMDCDNNNDGCNSSSSSNRVSAVNVNVNVSVDTNAHANGYCINNNNAMNNDNSCLCYGEEKECKYLHAVEELRRKATAEEVEEKAAARTFNIQIPTVLASSPSMTNQGMFSQLHSSSSLSVHTKLARELQTKLDIINEQLDIVSAKARDATTVTLQQKYKALRASFDFSFLDATKQKLQQLQQEEEEITVAHPLSVNTTTSKSLAKVQSLPQEAVVLINDDIVVGSASNSASQSHLQTMISQLNVVSQLNTKTNSSRKQFSFLTAASSQNNSNDDTYSTAANHLIDLPVSSERGLAETSFSHTTLSQQQQRFSSKLALLSSATKKRPPVSSERRFVETSLSSSPPPNLSIRGGFKLHSHDVVLNWDKFNHSGNKWYRQLIEKDRSSTDDEKPATAKAIVQAVHQRVPHGRFLKLSLPSNYWTVVPNEEAIDKTLQALHEPSPHQQVPSIRCNKRSVRGGDDGNNREAIDTNIPPMKKRRVHEVTASSEQKKLSNPCPQETTEFVYHGIGIENKISDYTFEERLTHLADYKKKHGDCNVPQRSKEYTTLGRWVNTQRDEYKKYKESKKSSMTKVRIRALEKLDFKWRLKLTFEDRLTQLADYKQKNGDCNVPRDFEENTTLGKWVSSQRTEYKRYKESKKSSMTKVRIRALEKLDFKWRLQLNFEDRLTQLADYKQKNGDCNVPSYFGENTNLGQWVSYQRTEYKKYKESKKSFMTKVRIRALERLGFIWHNSQSLEEIRHIPAGLSLLNNVAVVDDDKEQQIEHDVDDQLFGENNTNSSKNKSNINDDDDDDSDSNVLSSNEDVAVAIPLPILELPPVETVVYVDDEQQIEHNDDDLLLGRSKTSSNNSEDDDGSDNRVGSYSCYRAEEGDRIDNNEDFDGDGNGGWRDLGDEYYDTDDEDCLVF